MTQELLPCPFCGGEATINEIRRNGYRFAECESCAFGMCAERTKAEAITAWNTRAQSGNWQETLNELARLEAENARLREAFRLFPEAHDILTSAEMRDAKGNWRSLIDQQSNALRAALAAQE